MNSFSRILVTLFFALACLGQIMAQTDSTPKAAHIQFAEEMKDYGDIAYGDSISYTFVFTNTGNADLIIQNVITTCSCSSRKYTEGAIAPGKSGELTVSFNSKKQDKTGRMNKVFTILSNADNNPARVIMSCNVLEKQ